MTTKSPPLSLAAKLFLIAFVLLLPIGIYSSYKEFATRTTVAKYVCSIVEEDKRDLQVVTDMKTRCGQ